jgi:hypothetical protein
MAMEAMQQAEDAMHGQDQMAMEEMGGPAPLTVLQARGLLLSSASAAHPVIQWSLSMP